MPQHFFEFGLLLLGAAVFLVPLSKRLGLGSVLGYLSAGFLMGPFGFGWIGRSESAVSFSELGVVLLMFIIGLELQPKKLWSLRKLIFGFGAIQVLISSIVFTVVFKQFSFSWPQAVLIGMALSLSSTALVMQLFREKKLLVTPAGESVFSILLFQDLAVVPILSLLPFLSPVAPQPTLKGFFIGFAAIVGLVLFARFLLNPILRVIARSDLREVFTAFSLFLVLGVSFLMHEVGLSMALGTFISGVILANSEYRHELEINIEPFKGLLMGLFFIGVGLNINLNTLATSGFLVAAMVVILVLVKFVVVYHFGCPFGLSQRSRTIAAWGLAQGGEFAFVLFNVGTDYKIFDKNQHSILVLVVTLSLFITPLVFLILSRVKPAQKQQKEFDVPESKHPVIIGGFGRVGQIVARILVAKGFEVTLLDHDPEQVEVIKRFGWKAFYGDVSRLDLLHLAGAAQASLFVIAIDDNEATLKILDICAANFPKLKIIARVRGRTDAFHVLNKNYTPFRETFGTSLEMAEKALTVLGIDKVQSTQIVNKFRLYDEDLVSKSARHVGDERALISITKNSREELIRLLQSEEEPS